MEISISHLGGMEISVLEYWINHGTYADGVKIFEEIGTSTALKKLFQSENSYTRTKLRTEIISIYDRVKSELDSLPSNPLGSYHQPKAVEAYNFNSFLEGKKTIDRSKLTPELQSLYATLGPIITEMSYLHNRLDLMETDEERYLAASRICVELAPQRRRIFERCDKFMATGIDPEASEIIAPVVLTKEDLRQELLRVRVQVSKLKNKKDRAADFERYQNRKKELEDLLSL